MSFGFGFSFPAWSVLSAAGVVPPAEDVLLQEDGFNILQEDGSNILLES
jgi:hypothetical protein